MHIASNADASLNPHEPYCKIYGKPFQQTFKEMHIYNFHGYVLLSRKVWN